MPLHWHCLAAPLPLHLTSDVCCWLLQFADAQARDLDCWRLRLLLPNSSYKPGSTYAVSQIPVDPEAVAAQAALVCSSNGSRPGCAGEAQQVLMEGTFYNYFSVGADAQAAYNFHHLRDTHPMLASNRVANQFWYGAFSCTSGTIVGLCCVLFRTSILQHSISPCHPSVVLCSN
eukprot:GHRR01015845.1.p2 GENE.GHRR01015845.1~~GHRR01015845.1.p2  ORF type:complete len:174 (-),score=49.54 GHRR01015845.1:590-1111(-)